MRYSDNYNLKLPQRGVDRANVDDLDSNFETIDGALADDRQISLLMYDSTSTYNTGDIVGYENPTTHRIRAYRCLEDNVTGPWDATKWAQTTLAEEIENGGGGTDVEANPSGTATADLEKLRVGQTIYGLPTDMTGATSQEAGTHGLVPAPSAGDEGKVLYGDGTWKTPQSAPSNLGDLGDVTLTTPSDGQTLTYDDGEWVNKDLPAVTKTASGNPIEITDGASAPLVKCVTQITGYQSGTGTPSPDNIRPITAYTEGKIEVRGKNLAKECIRGYFNAVGGVVKVDNANESVLFYATQGESYVLSSGVTSAVANRSVLGRVETTNIVNNTPIYGAVETGFDGTWTATWTGWTLWYKCSSLSMDFENSVQIEKGETATTYEPYTATTHSTTFPSAIYRGSEDVVNGEVTTDTNVIVLDGVTHYFAEPNVGYWHIQPYDYSAIALSGNAIKWLICEIAEQQAFGQAGSGSILFTRSSDWASVFPTVNDLNDYITNHPITIAYELATPTTTPVTPTNLTIRTLNGYSHIESSTGDMEIEYITSKYSPITEVVSRQISTVEKLLELIITANREEEMKATQNYTAGVLLIVSGKLYKASSNIANGSTLVINSNVTSTTIAAELAALA